MSKNIFLFLIAIFSISCKKNIALFQPTKNISYTKEKSIINEEIPIETQLDLPLLTSSEFTDIKNLDQKKYSEALPPSVINQTGETIQSKVFLEKVDSERLDFKNTEKIDLTKKRKKLYPAFNDNLKIGIVFLVIAAVLGILNLSQLMLVFALASLIFLYLGLKKYFRRKRIKSWFKK